MEDYEIIEEERREQQRQEIINELENGTLRDWAKGYRRKRRTLLEKSIKNKEEYKRKPELYRGKEWKDRRLQSLYRDNFKCTKCGTTQEESKLEYKLPLQVHHIEPYKLNHNNNLDNLITVCCNCHYEIEGKYNIGFLKLKHHKK